jgi:hypothetical protein
MANVMSCAPRFNKRTASTEVRPNCRLRIGWLIRMRDGPAGSSNPVNGKGKGKGCKDQCRIRIQSYILLKATIMNRFIGGVFAAAVAASLAVGAHAATQTTKSAYDDAKVRADATYKTERGKCDALAGNAKDVCVAEAKAHRMRSEAAAKAVYKHTRNAWYDQQVNNADADYLVAKEKCDALAGNDEDICLKEAKAARTKAIADAKEQRRAAEAQGEARKETSNARREANEERRDDYKVELQRCDNLAGEAKDSCVARAKRGFGKS